MNRTSDQDKDKLPSKNISLDFDLFDKSEENDFLEISFRPVTKGLGFHNEQKKITAHSLKTREPITPTLKKPRRPQRAQDPLANFYQNEREKKTIGPETLAPFYNKQNEKKLAKNDIKKIKITPKEREAQIHRAFFAWLIDIGIITFSFFMTAIGFFFFSGLDLATLTEIIDPIEVFIFAFFIYTVFYLMYFTLLDLVSTPGNALFGLKLLNVDHSQVRPKNTFLRGCLTYLVLLTGIITYFLTFQNKLSDTKLVQS